MLRMCRSRNLLGGGLRTGSCDPNENIGASRCVLQTCWAPGPRGCVTWIRVPSLKLNSAP